MDVKGLVSRLFVLFLFFLAIELQRSADARLLREKPDRNNAAATARWLVSQNSWGSLNTISVDLGGAPFGNIVSFSDGQLNNGSGIPYFYLTALDPTARNAFKDPRSSLTISEYPLGTCGAKDPENPSCAKLTLTGKLKVLKDTSGEAEIAKSALFTKHPEMKGWPKSRNFQFFKLDIEDIFLINWFGGPKPLTVNQYLHPKAKRRVVGLQNQDGAGGMRTSTSSYMDMITSHQKTAFFLFDGIPVVFDSAQGRLLVGNKPEPRNAAATARWLVSQNSWGVLNTISIDLGGAPFGNVVSYSDGIPNEGSGIPYFYLTTLDPTAKNALKDQRSSFTVSEYPLGTCGKKDPENPTCAKITLTGKLKLLEKHSKEGAFAQKVLFAKHPEMKGWPKSHNFRFFKLDIEDIFLIDWFGGPKPLTVEQYLHPTSNGFVLSL